MGTCDTDSAVNMFHSTYHNPDEADKSTDVSAWPWASLTGCLGTFGCSAETLVSTSLSSGACVDDVDPEGRTPLALALTYVAEPHLHAKMVLRLLRHGSSLSHPNVISAMRAGPPKMRFPLPWGCRLPPEALDRWQKQCQQQVDAISDFWRCICTDYHRCNTQSGRITLSPPRLIDYARHVIREQVMNPRSRQALSPSSHQQVLYPNIEYGAPNVGQATCLSVAIINFLRYEDIGVPLKYTNGSFL